MSEADVIVRREGGAGILSLNRPRSLHALTHAMCLAMTEALVSWRDDAGVAVVILDHAVDSANNPGRDPKLSRGFCAGGDIKLLRRAAIVDGGIAARQFFSDEYRLNHLMFTYPKPIVAFMDGLTMGGGVGISQPAAFRVATQNTRFAMPETAIGMIPDVGGGWYLSRLAGRLGAYVALTCARLDGAECLWAGLATHYLASAALVDAKARLIAGAAPGAVLDALAMSPPAPKIAARMADINRHFAGESYPAILASLAADDSDWARATLAGLADKSPFACAAALRHLAQSLALSDFAANLAQEYRVMLRMMVRPDFPEGVRALIIDKDHAPSWNPATPEGVTATMLDAVYAPLPANEEWTP